MLIIIVSRNYRALIPLVISEGKIKSNGLDDASAIVDFIINNFLRYKIAAELIRIL